MGNAKIFPQLMLKSRGLAKISERRLQPLLVREIADQSKVLAPYCITKAGGGGMANQIMQRRRKTVRNCDIINIKIKSLLYSLEYIEA